MKSPVCEMLGIEFPLFAFSHCRDVVAAVSRAGGFGVLGATGHTPRSVHTELKWIDEHVDGKPYGIDILVPENMATAGEKGVTYNSLQLARAAGAPRLRRQPAGSGRRRDCSTCEVSDDRAQPFDPEHAHAHAGGGVRASDQADRQCAGRAAAGDDRDGQEARRAGGRPGRRQGACACARSRPASTSWWCRAPRPAATAARSPPWCWCRR